MPKFRFVAAISVSLCLAVCASARGETAVPARGGLSAGSFIIHSWGIKEGLPQSSVISLTQTRDGYLWLGTLNGVARFDGVRFTVFDEANTPGLGSSRIVRVFEDSRTNLWLGTETAGVVLVREGVVTGLRQIGGGSREGRLMSVCEDASGAVWFYTADGQLFRFMNGQVNAARLGAEFLSSSRVVAAEQHGPLWVGTHGILFQVGSNSASEAVQLPPVESEQAMQVDFLLAGKSGGCWRLADGRVQFWRTNRLERDLGAYPWRADAPPATACEDDRGNLIVGTLGDGVFWFDAAGGFTRINAAAGLSHDWVLSLCMDNEGSLWVGTDGGGLNRVRRSVFSVVPESRKSVVQSVCADGEGGLWMGLNRGGAIHQKGGVTRNYGFTEGLFNLDVWSVFVDNRGRLWAGTWGGLYLFDARSEAFHPVLGNEALQRSVLAIHQDRGGRLWFGTQLGLVCWDEREWRTYTTRDGLSSDAVRAIADDGSGGVWIGTIGGGLNRLQADKVEAFRKSEHGLPSDDISSLLVDDEGVLWVGTFGSGLARFHNGKWTRFTTRDGLSSNGIGYLIEDGEGFLWIGSNTGLMRVSRKALNDLAEGRTGVVRVRIYGEDDGLPTRECTQGSQPGACRTEGGRLWFPTIKGLVSVDAEQLSPNPTPPPVVIESVLVAGREQITNALRAALPAGIVIPPLREQMEIHYTSLNLAAADRARFSYRMEGYESDWFDAGASRVARYPKLPPGDYTFHVRARNEDGVASRTSASLSITVLPPFWKTWWFRAGAVALLLAIVAGVVHYVSTKKLQRQLELLRQQEALERDRARIARDLHDQLGASLTQVALLGELVESDKDLPSDVEAHGRQISQTARETTHVLDEIVWAVNPQNDTLDGLVSYICKNAQDYLAVAGLRYRLDVPQQLPPLEIAPEVRHNVFLAAKEAVTNIVRHSQASEARIRVRFDEIHFDVEIQDNGHGVDLQKPTTRNGLRNMRKRMEDVGGEFAIGPAAGGGTIVKLTAPIKRS